MFQAVVVSSAVMLGTPSHSLTVLTGLEKINRREIRTIQDVRHVLAIAREIQEAGPVRRTAQRAESAELRRETEELKGRIKAEIERQRAAKDEARKRQP
jgi:hypothetical protein